MAERAATGKKILHIIKREEKGMTDVEEDLDLRSIVSASTKVSLLGFDGASVGGGGEEDYNGEGGGDNVKIGGGTAKDNESVSNIKSETNFNDNDEDGDDNKSASGSIVSAEDIRSQMSTGDTKLKIRPKDGEWIMGEDWEIAIPTDSTIPALKKFIQDHKGISVHRQQIRMESTGKYHPPIRDKWTLRRLNVMQGSVLCVSLIIWRNNNRNRNDFSSFGKGN